MTSALRLTLANSVKAMPPPPPMLWATRPGLFLPALNSWMLPATQTDEAEVLPLLVVPRSSWLP